MPKGFRSAIVLGERFGSWTVLGLSHVKSSMVFHRDVAHDVEHRVPYVLAKCDCGHEGVTSLTGLKSGKSTQCKACGSKRPSGAHNKGWKGIGLVPRNFVTALQHGAARRGHEFSVTIEELSKLWEDQRGRCALTGQLLVLVGTRQRSKLSEEDRARVASVDRVDPSLGYVIGNVRWVTSRVNYAKHVLTDSEFLKLVEQIYDFTKCSPAFKPAGT